MSAGVGIVRTCDHSSHAKAKSVFIAKAVPSFVHSEKPLLYRTTEQNDFRSLRMLCKRQSTHLLVIPLSRRRIFCPTEEAAVDKIDKSITKRIDQSINLSINLLINQSTSQSTLIKNCQSLVAKQNN